MDEREIGERRVWRNKRKDGGVGGRRSNGVRERSERECVLHLSETLHNVA